MLILVRRKTAKGEFMKKIVLVTALITFLGAGAAFADFGIGVHGGGGMMGGGGGLNLAFDNIFIYIDASYLGASGLSLSGACDFYQFLGGNIIDNLNWYWRVGVPASLWFGNDTVGLAIGVRAPVGLSYKPIDLIELFVQVFPQVNLQLLPDVNLWHNWIGGNLGIRFWF